MRATVALFPSIALVAFSVSSPALFAQKQPFDVKAMLSLNRINDPALSPDGRSVAFTVQTVDLDKNTKPQQIFVVPLDGGTPRQITFEGTSNERPRWSPDSRQIFYISNRSGSGQIWVMNADGLAAKQVTNLSTEASGEIVSADGKKLVFLSQVYPECSDDACNKRSLDDEAKSKLKTRIYTTLLYRHWTEFKGKRRQHIFSINTDGTELKDLTQGIHEAPPFSLGGSGDDYTISPDSSEVALTMNVDENQATSTNSDIYTVPIAGGGEPRRITVGLGAENAPAYSPDGRSLAFRSQQRAGYESDRWRLMVLDRATGRTLNLTEGLDRWVEAFTWSPDSTRIFYTSEDRGRTGLSMLPATGGGSRPIVFGSSTLSDVQFTPDGKTMIFLEQSGSRPAELFRAVPGGSPTPLTHLNDALLSRYQLTPLEEFSVESTDKTRVSAFVVKPPDFKDSNKYPVLFLIHGGPQGSWGESWSYRWNAQVFAGAGYLVVMPNPRGSTGYGQKFIDDINNDWGGKPYDDIMSVADRVITWKYADADRLAAAGGSYGGYMVDWLLGHTNRFKALVSHAGVYDLRSMAGETEELWFPLWEFRGMPWDNPDAYARWSPSFFAKDFKTPTLVFHGELDYRVPVGQGMQLFTALQLQKIPSKMVLFPDEGHWILKPQNSVLWYTQFLDWVGEWTKKSQ
jgi:dipeptidyl aminopeptidase/acylaminoacyl peptidase